MKFPLNLFNNRQQTPLQKAFSSSVRFIIKSTLVGFIVVILFKVMMTNFD